MPKKTIELSGMVDADTAAINLDGFPKIKNAVSRSKAYRLGKKKKELDCDPACDVKSQEALAKILCERYNKYGSKKAVARLEQNSLHYVKVGKDHFYCTDSVYYYIEKIHQQNVRDTKLRNLKSGCWTDPSSSYI